MKLRRGFRHAGRAATATVAALALVTGGALASAAAPRTGPPAPAVAPAAVGTTTAADAAATAPETVAAAVDVDRYPLGVGADLGTQVRAHGIETATAPTAGAQEVGEAAGRAFWRTDAAAGAERFVVDVADDYLARLAGRPGYLVVDHQVGTAPTVTTAAADGTPVELAGTAEPDADGDGWTSTVVGLSAGTLRAGADGTEITLAPSGAGELTVAGLRLVAQGVNVDLGPAVAENGITVRAGDQTGGLVTGTDGERGYWQTGKAGGTAFVYVNVASTYLQNTTDRVLVDVVTQDAGGNMFLQYDSPGETIPERFKRSSTITLPAGGGWAGHSWLLEDAILTDRSNGSDFRVSVEDSPTDVRFDRIAVTGIPVEVDPTLALRRLVRQADVAHDAAREGDRDGQYPAGSRATLQEAIDAAQAVVDDENTTGEEADAAIDALEITLEQFLALERTTDLARGAAATAGSTSDGSPGALTDGDDGSYWTSARDAGADWVQLDLGEVTRFNEVLARWPGDYANVYGIEVSTDGSTFTEVASAGALGGHPVRTRFEPVDARYVRLELTRYATGHSVFSLRSLEVRLTLPTDVNPRIVETVFPTEDVVVAEHVVTELGADPTGVEDSTAAIQAALYACEDATGGTVWLPAGTYRVTGTLEVGAHCTLRGDHPDAALTPDGDPLDGTVVVADLPSGDDGPSLFRIGGNAGVMGVTTWYPGQDAAEPVPYGFTFEIPGRAWQGEHNYMMSSIEHVTMLNSYRGIGVSTMAHDRGESGPGSQVHEIANVRDVTGTALFIGVEAYNGADVGTWQDVTFDNGVWAAAGADYNAPDRAVLDAWTRANGTGFVLGDLEWDEFTDIAAADYRFGIHIVRGQRAEFTGSFINADIRDTDVAVQVDQADGRWGTAFTSSVLDGSVAAVRNLSAAYVKLTDTATSGASEGIVHVLDGPADGVPAVPETVTAPRPAEHLVDVTAAPYDVPRTPGEFSDVDATAGIQAALDDVADAGGGVVYLPAGWYTVRGRLTVPEGVELRGSAGVANRDSLELSGGTVLMAYDGRTAADDPAADTAPAFITLAGEDAGVRGLRVFHPENNPASDDGVVAYPYAVRGDAPGTYAVNVGLTNAWNGIDMTDAADGFLVRRAVGLYFAHGVRAGANEGGTVENVLSNGNVITRVAYGLPGWVEGDNLFAQVIDGVARQREVLVQADGSQGLTVLNTFAYGSHDGIVARDGATVTAFNVGTDNLGPGGYSVDADETSAVDAVNLMRYNGTTSRGPVTITNPMAINMVQRSLAVSVEPEGSGAVRVVGNETEPGRYEAGSALQLVAEPGGGFVHTGWRDESGAVVSTEPTLDLVLDADRSLVAVFEEAPPLSIAVTVAPRCAGPLVLLPVEVGNVGASTVKLRITTPYGSRDVSKVAPGKTVSRTFVPGRSRVPAGEVTVVGTVRGTDLTRTTTVAYDALDCRR